MRLSEADFTLVCESQKTKKPAAPKESDIQRQIIQMLKWHGWFAIKIHQSLGSYKGIADVYALKDGRHIWVEVKTPKGKQSDPQVKFQRDVEFHGGSYILARSVDDVMDLCEKNW
jgi:Holliday junction resolvase